MGSPALILLAVLAVALCTALVAMLRRGFARGAHTVLAIAYDAAIVALILGGAAAWIGFVSIVLHVPHN